MTDEKLFIGMDLHQRTSTFAVKDRDVRKISEATVETDRDAITMFIRSLPSPCLSIALEPVSQWYVYADHLQGLGCEVHLAHPLRVKAIASARVKTDTIDAGVLCDLLRSNLLPEAYFSSKEVRSWKEVVRYRAQVIHQRAQVKNQLHAILHKNGVRHEFSDLFGKKGIVWLNRLEIPEPFRTNLTEHLRTLDWLNERIVDADRRVEALVHSHPQAELLTTIPGISFVSALTIIAEIGDITRFKSPKKLMGYAGLVPSTSSSGGRTTHGRITKQGSKWLRWIMVEVAQKQQLCRRTIGLSPYFNRIKARKGTNPATVATARKLLAVIWRMLTDNRPFSMTPPDRHGRRPEVIPPSSARPLAEVLSSPVSSTS